MDEYAFKMTFKEKLSSFLARCHGGGEIYSKI
jgi:hypothetical protein